jgi:membrane protease YdiL (CAAX protease family)
VTLPDLTSYVLAGIGLSVVAIHRMRVRRGADPLPPVPVAPMADTTPWLLLGLALWWGGDALVVRSVAGSLAPVGQVAVSAAAHLAVALVLLPVVLRTWRPSPLPLRVQVTTGLLAGLATYGLTALTGIFLMRGYHMFEAAVPTQAIVRVAQAMDARDFAIFAVSAGLGAPLAEEVLYRGVMLPALLRGPSPAKANFAQAILFGAAHFVARPSNELPLAIPLAVVGWCAGWAALRTRSLLPAVLVHATFNGLNLVFLRLQEPG